MRTPTSLPVLLVALVVATCGLVYELLAGTVASWALGDSVTEFSTVIGTYLGALGLGSYLSRHLEHDLARRFVLLELLVALVGGLSTPLLFLLFDHRALFRLALLASVLACGTLVGLEIPLLLRLLGPHEGFRTTVARVLAYDHLGSLAGSLLYALVLAPRLGPFRTAPVVALLNVAAALLATRALSTGGSWRALRLGALAVGVVLALVLASSGSVLAHLGTLA